MTEQELYKKLYQSIIVDDNIVCLGQILRRAARKAPQTVAVICKDEQITFYELYYYASRLSEKITQQGVKPRDRVLLFFENSIQFYVAYFAILQASAIACPLNTFLKEHELRHIIHDAQPKLMFVSTTLMHRVKDNGIEDLPQLMTEEEMMSGAVPEHFEEKPIETLAFDEMAVLLYTSGTTGLPKGVMLSSKNAITNVIQSVARFGWVDYERGYCVLPLFHSLAQNTCVWAPVLMTCSVIVVPRIERDAMRQGLAHKPTIFLGIPALYGILCLMKNAPLDSIKYFFSGGDALPDKIRAAFSLVYRRKICNGFGLTETSPVIAIDLDDVLQRTTTVGKPVIGMQIVIKDEQGNQVLNGSIGEIFVKGDNVMLGYYKDQPATDRVLQNGWLQTGDLGYFDKNEKLVISGRIKDLIIHKGLNIYPQEIENVLMTHPNVLLVGVVGLQDELHGEVPVAFVQLKNDEPEIEKNLRELCSAHLASYKIPRKFICSTKRLDLTSTGKVDKKILRAQLHEQTKK